MLGDAGFISSTVLGVLLHDARQSAVHGQPRTTRQKIRTWQIFQEHSGTFAGTWWSDSLDAALMACSPEERSFSQTYQNGRKASCILKKAGKLCNARACRRLARTDFLILYGF